MAIEEKGIGIPRFKRFFGEQKGLVLEQSVTQLFQDSDWVDISTEWVAVDVGKHEEYGEAWIIRFT